MHDNTARDRTDDGTARVSADDEMPDWSDAIVADVVEYEGEPDECTLYPLDATDETVVTTWISAREGGFVALDEMA
ncbi:MAG: hypothetical protein ABEJ04_02100 [Halobacteriaceae archaeon]